MDKIRVGCAVLVERDGKLLLGSRGKEPDYGLLIIPGGGVDFCESLYDTARREIREECGIEIKNIRQFRTYEIINRERKQHRIITYMFAEYENGELVPSDDLLDAKFYAKDEILELARDRKVSPHNVYILQESGWIDEDICKGNTEAKWRKVL